MKRIFPTISSRSTAVFVHFISALAIATTVAIASGPTPVLAQSPVVNVIHAGGSDVEDPDLPGSGPGFDKNYSLVAFKFADGTASGKLIDRYAGGGGLGLKGDINCVHVVGNTAWLSGHITQGQTLDDEGNPVDITGYYVRTRVQDNGDNTDPANPDRVAFTQFRNSAPFPCANMFGSAFWDMPGGQVTIR
jgi:hypothetical protein